MNTNNHANVQKENTLISFNNESLKDIRND